MGTLPWGWHEDRAAPVLPNVGEHDDLALTTPEHDTMRDIAAHWDDEVPCNYGRIGEPPLCSMAAVWETRCPGCGYAWVHCDEHRRTLDEFDAHAGPDDTVKCAFCNTIQPTPVVWNRL